ncbi:MAG: hypothetical protein R2877_02485 [Bdellovibrionota bacterium]
MIQQLQASRPLSYVNIALSGLGAVAAGTRLAQISKVARYKKYLDARGGSLDKTYAASQEAWFGRQAKPSTMTRAKIKETAAKIKGPEPKGIKHDLGEAKLRDYLNFVKSEKGSGSGMFPNQPGTYGYVKPTPSPGAPSVNGGGAGVALKAPGTTTKTVTSTKPSSVIAKPTVQPSTPQAKMEILPDVVPMPVIPDILEPVEFEQTNKKIREILEEERKGQQRRAEEVIENDLDETDLLVISTIDEISKGQGYLATKAKDWIAKHGGLGRGHYDGNATHFLASAERNRSHNHASRVEIDFLEVENDYTKLERLLQKRDGLMNQIIRKGILVESEKKKFMTNLDEKWSEDLLRNPIVELFDSNRMQIQLANEKIVIDLENVFLKYGFLTKKFYASNGIYELEITPTKETQFYGTLEKYFSKSEHRIEKFKFIFNPVELHIRFAGASVNSTEVEFGLETAKNIILNEMGTVELHEIRHLYFEELRENRTPSIYHQSYGWENGDLNSTKIHQHYVSAEEIYAYGHDLKNELATNQKVMREIQKGREGAISDYVDLDEIESVAGTLRSISMGILHSSHDVLTAINERSYQSLDVGGLRPSIYLNLDNGMYVEINMVSKEQRDTLFRYMGNKPAFEVDILRHIYDKQKKLNHLAYQQVIFLNALVNALSNYEVSVKAFEKDWKESLQVDQA